MRLNRLLLALFIIILVITFSVSCNDSAAPDYSSTDSIATSIEPTDTTTPASNPDTSEPPPPPPPPHRPAINPPAPDESSITEGKSAVLGYSHPERVKRNQPKDVNVFLTVNLPESKLRDTLKKIIKSQLRNIREDDTTHILTENLILYEEVEVKLFDPGNVFTITSYAPEKQRVDTIHGNRWRWSINTTTNMEYADLVLVVTVKNPNTEPVRFEDHNFKILIEVDAASSIFRRSWIYLIDNPAVIITVILIPLITFFGKRYFDKRDKRKIG